MSPLVPANTPVEIIHRRSREIHAAYTDPAMMARLLDTGGPILPGSPADFAQLMSAETEKWAKGVRQRSEAAHGFETRENWADLRREARLGHR